MPSGRFPRRPRDRPGVWSGHGAGRGTSRRGCAAGDGSVEARPAAVLAHALAELDVVVLAGGLGTRLRPVVADRPKVLAPVGRPAVPRPAAGLAGTGRAPGAWSWRWATWPSRWRRVWTGCAARFPASRSRPCASRGRWAPAARSPSAARCCAPTRSWSMNGDSLRRGRPRGLPRGLPGLSGAAAGLVAVQVQDAARYGRLELSPGAGCSASSRRTRRRRPGLDQWRRLPAPAGLLEQLPPAAVTRSSATCSSACRRAACSPSPRTGRFIDIGTPESLAAHRRARPYPPQRDPGPTRP